MQVFTGVNGCALARLLVELDIGLMEFALDAGVPVITAKRLMNSSSFSWNKARVWRNRTIDFVTKRGATAEQIAALFAPENKLAAEVSNTAAAALRNPKTKSETTEGETMLLQNETLTQDARKHFGLPRSPFVDDVQTPADVFQNEGIRFVRASLEDCALHHGFLALVGESGAGKSTLAEDLEERLRKQSREVVIIRPYVLGMEENDRKGQTLKSSAIAEAIITALDPHAVPRQSPQARFAQAHELLRSSHLSGRRHLLLIEEAHNMPVTTLKHLKRYLELKDGMRRLLGIALIGQPELRRRLSAQNADVREVAQRCEIVNLDPLNADLEGYLRHKFARFDLSYERVFSPDAADAIRERLTFMPRGGKAHDAISICYPLVVNNLVCRAMNAAAEAGSPTVNADVIGGC